MAKKILLIESDELVAKLIAKKISSLDYELLAADNGEDGEALIAENPDSSLILIAAIMSQKSGFDVLAEIRKDAKLSKIPVIVISNSGHPAELEKAQKYGVKDWIIKTDFDPSEVVKKIVKIIG
jgi:two-component system alkaline phosphatase synthesis response regulator PhoP